MADEAIKKEDLKKLEENLGQKIEDLARITAKGFEGVDKRFEENAKQHQEIFEILDDHSERLKRIETKLENVVYRREFEELKNRVGELENLLTIIKDK